MGTSGTVSEPVSALEDIKTFPRVNGRLSLFHFLLLARAFLHSVNV